MKINGVDFDLVTKDAIEAAKKVVTGGIAELDDIVKNIGDSLSSDIEFVAKKIANDEFEESDAKLFMEDQKIVARMRLRSIAIITMKMAEDIWNKIVGVFNKAIEDAIGFAIL